MGAARRARAAARAAGQTPPPAVAPVKVRRRELLIPVDLDERIENEFGLLPSDAQKAMTVNEMLVDLIRATFNQIDTVRQNQQQANALIQPATHVPAGMADAAARLQALRAGR